MQLLFKAMMQKIALDDDCGGNRMHDGDCNDTRNLGTSCFACSTHLSSTGKGSQRGK